MVMTPSRMLALGTKAPGFELSDFEGRRVGLRDFDGSSGLLVMFICNHCPFVKHIRAGLAALAREYQARGLAIVAINSNDIDNYSQDGPEGMKEEAASAGYVFPYLLDDTQEVAKTYEAACTPDFFLFDQDCRLVYRGQFDGSRPGNDVPVTGLDLRAAADAVLEGWPVPEDQKPSIGCNIKWKPGNEPEYFSA
jgi:peroxiredoxin